MTEIDKEREYYNNFQFVIFDINYVGYERQQYLEANPDWNENIQIHFMWVIENLSIERIIEIFLSKDWFDKMDIEIIVPQLYTIVGTLNQMIRNPNEYIGNFDAYNFYKYPILFAILNHFRKMNKDYNGEGYKWNLSILYFFKNKTAELYNHYEAIIKVVRAQQETNSLKEMEELLLKREQHTLLMKQKINNYHKEKRPCSNCNKLVSVSNMATHKRSDSCINFKEKEEKPIKPRNDYMNEKLPCQFCNKLVSRSNMPKHNKTDSCITIRNILLTTNKDKDIDLEI
jgi:hypothetical protein